MNLQNIISTVKEVQHKFLSFEKNTDEIIEEVKKYILSNIDILEEAHYIDKNEKISREKIEQQFMIEPIEKSDTLRNEFGKVTNLYVPLGVLGVISNSDIYVILRIMILAILTRNGLIINITENVGTNYLMITNVNKILSEYGFENLIEIYNNNAGDTLEESEDIDGIIYVGKKANAERIKISSTKPVIYSGCGNYELYIEDNLDEKLIQNGIHNKNIKIYSIIPDFGQKVRNLEEAIIRINEEGNGYSVGIITESRENAKKFVGKINARNIFVNAIPTLIDNRLDIGPIDLMYKKSVLVYE